MANGELHTEHLEVPARVYPGMFDREVQATVVIEGHEITVIASPDDVVLEDGAPSENGTKARLRVAVVQADQNSLLIDLPGEPLGASRRFRVHGDPSQAFAM